MRILLSNKLISKEDQQERERERKADLFYFFVMPMTKIGRVCKWLSKTKSRLNSRACLLFCLLFIVFVTFDLLEICAEVAGWGWSHSKRPNAPPLCACT